MIKKSLKYIFSVSFAAVIAIFLTLSYSTMYKQNHAIPILEYHHLAAEPDSSLPWTVTVNDFEEQMSYLDNHFTVVPLQTLLEALRQKKDLPENPIAITFDDGYLSNYTLAYPILKRHKLPATIFVIVRSIEIGKIGSSPSMNWGQLKEMADSGLITIESHTYDLHHTEPAGPYGNPTPAVLARIPTPKGTETEEEHARRIAEDLTKSSRTIEANLGKKPVMLSWPYGLSEKKANTIAQSAGFIYLMEQIGYTNPHTPSEKIGRVVVASNTDLAAFQTLVNPPKVSYLKAINLQLQRLLSYLPRAK